MPTDWFLCSLLLVAAGYEKCEEGVWERESDKRLHECRSCKDVTIDRINCPATGYNCDENEPLRATVPSALDACSCQSLRCSNSGWRLAVNGTIVDQVRCNGRQWFSSGLLAQSFICAAKEKKCPALTSVWNAAECALAWQGSDELTYKCTPSASSTTEFTCSTGHPTIKGSDNKIKPESIICDSTKGAWIYDDGSSIMSEADLATAIGSAAPYEFACVEKDQASVCNKCTIGTTPLVFSKQAWTTVGGWLTETPPIDNSGQCTKMKVTCNGMPNKIMIYRDAAATDLVYSLNPSPTAPSTLEFVCNAAGTGWEAVGLPGANRPTANVRCVYG